MTETNQEKALRKFDLIVSELINILKPEVINMINEIRQYIEHSISI